MKKAGIVITALLLWVTAFSQQRRTTKGKAKQAKTTTVVQSNRAANNKATNTTNAAPALGAPGNTITDKRLKGTTQTTTRNNGGKNRNNVSATNNNTNTGVDNGTFASGMHPADNAKQKFDSVPPANPNSINNRPVSNVTVAGGNDTTVNVNTLTENGLPTNSGAVDKSGQAQFGQTNWGNGRSTVGESQWTVPPPITASFNKDFPTISNATWARSNVDTSIYSARYQSGAVWITTNYNAAGQRFNTRTEIQLRLAPVSVHNYLSRQPAGFRPAAIYRVEMQGKPDMYEIQSTGGKTVYLNIEGNEVRQ